MKKLEFKILCSGHEYLIAYDPSSRGGRRLDIVGPNLYGWANDGLYYEDFEQVEWVSGYFDGKNAVIGSDSYALIEGKKIKKFKLKDEIAKVIRAAIAESYKAWRTKEKDIEAHRTAPYVDKSKFEMFFIGETNSKIYHDNPKVIMHALRNHFKVYNILTGVRDGSNKYPQTRDVLIPEDFTKKIKGEYVGVGYEYFFVSRYGILKEDYQKALDELVNCKMF